MVVPGLPPVNSRGVAGGPRDPGGRRGPDGPRDPGGPRWVALGLGSNLGDRAAFLELARLRLRAAGYGWTLAGPVDETPPVGGPPGQGPYLNQVLVAAAEAVAPDPGALLDAALAIEREAGRERRVRWGPRTLDIDLLLWADLVLERPGLSLPHPRLLERPWVLAPLARLIPGAVHPVTGRTLADHAAPK
jgi:2-amino-4-hydroxy-6-hydroxymethyldihydropteridine diphosphokinase